MPTIKRLRLSLGPHSATHSGILLPLCHCTYLKTSRFPLYHFRNHGVSPLHLYYHPRLSRRRRYNNLHLSHQRPIRTPPTHLLLHHPLPLHIWPQRMAHRRLPAVSHDLHRHGRNPRLRPCETKPSGARSRRKSTPSAPRSRAIMFLPDFTVVGNTPQSIWKTDL